MFSFLIVPAPLMALTTFSGITELSGCRSQPTIDTNVSTTTRLCSVFSALRLRAGLLVLQGQLHLAARGAGAARGSSRTAQHGAPRVLSAAGILGPVHLGQDSRPSAESKVPKLVLKLSSHSC